MIDFDIRYSWAQVLTLHYSCFIFLLYWCYKVLRKSKGNSLLAIFSIGLSLQVGLLYFMLPDAVELLHKDVRMPNIIIMGVAFSIYYVISSIGLIYEYNRFNYESKERSEGRFIGRYKFEINRRALKVVSVVSVLFIAYKLSLASSKAVLSQGLSALGSDEYSALRVNLTKIGQEDPTSGLVNMLQTVAFGIILMSFLWLIFFNIKMTSKYKTSNKRYIILFGFILLLVAFLRFEKAPIIILVLCIIYAYNSKLLKIKFTFKNVSFGIVIFAFLNFLGVYIISLTQGIAYQESLYFLYSRFFLIPTVTSAMHFEVYPHIYSFVYYTHIGLIRGLFSVPSGVHTGDIAIDVAQAMTGLYYHANACAVASGWAEAGYIGVIFTSFLICILFYQIDRYTFKKVPRIMIVPLLQYYFYWFVYYGNSALENVIIASSVWLIPFIYLKFIKIYRVNTVTNNKQELNNIDV